MLFNHDQENNFSKVIKNSLIEFLLSRKDKKRELTQSGF